MPRPRVHDAETADALVDAAARRLGRHGPGDVSVRTVAEDVGVSTRAVYSLFGSRDELLQEVYRRGFDGLATELADRPDDGDPLDDLRRLGWAYRRSALARPSLYHAMFHGAEVDRDFEETASRDTFEVLQDAVTRCVEAELLRGEPLALARQLWALVHGLVLLELSGSLGDEPAELYAQAMRAMVVGHAGPALAARTGTGSDRGEPDPGESPSGP